MTKKVGRPSEYTPEMVDKVDEYLAECKIWWDEFHKTRGEKSDTYERVLNVKLPMVEGFAEYIDVSKRTLYNWAEKHEEFMHALDRISRQQHNMLAEGGIAGYFSPVITKLMLSNNHGYTEKSNVDHTTKGDKITFTNEQLDTIFKRRNTGSDTSS